MINHSNKPAASSYDLIGDVHGEADQLKSLLHQLGYNGKQGAWRHPKGNRAIFVGDLVDRGPKVAETIRLVRSMVEAGSAEMVLGNHEFNLLCLRTPDGNGGFLRPHTDRNLKASRTTLTDFEGREKELDDHLEWFRTLPLYLDLGAIRVIHAEWNPELLARIKGRTYLDDDFLQKAVTKNTENHRTIEVLLKGSEAPLPFDAVLKDHDGTERRHLRVRWPIPGAGRTMNEISFPTDDTIPNVPVPIELAECIKGYGTDEPPVFFGHYALKNQRNGLITPNAACLDYGCGKGGRLGAYRWSGEQTLSTENFVTN